MLHFRVRYDDADQFGSGVADFWIDDPNGKLNESTFDHYANQCFGIRKSMSRFELLSVEDGEIPLPWRDLPGAAVCLKHNGDTIVWNAAGDKIKSEFD